MTGRRVAFDLDLLTNPEPMTAVKVSLVAAVAGFVVGVRLGFRRAARKARAS